MDPENVRTIGTATVTVIVGVVPAWLIYRQNTTSNEREATERREIREADLERTAREASERAASDKAAARELDRRRYVRFIMIVDKIASTMFTSSTFDVGDFSLSPDDRRELAKAYADVAFSTDDATRESAKLLRDDLDELVLATSESGAAPTTDREEQHKRLIEQFRESAQHALTRRPTILRRD